MDFYLNINLNLLISKIKYIILDNMIIYQYFLFEIIGYVLGLYYGFYKFNNFHGPDSNDIRKLIEVYQSEIALGKSVSFAGRTGPNAPSSFPWSLTIKLSFCLNAQLLLNPDPSFKLISKTFILIATCLCLKSSFFRKSSATFINSFDPIKVTVSNLSSVVAINPTNGPISDP